MEKALKIFGLTVVLYLIMSFLFGQARDVDINSKSINNYVSNKNESVKNNNEIRVSIESFEAFNENGVVLKINSLRYSEENNQCGLTYSLYNNSNQDIKFSVSVLNVNGYSLYAYSGIGKAGSYTYGKEVKDIVYSNGKSSGNIVFSTEDAALTNIKLSELQYINFKAVVSDLNGKVLFVKDVEVKTNKNGLTNQSYTFNGDIVYEDQHVKVGFKKYKNDINTPLIVFVENKMDLVTTFYYEGIKINNTSINDAALVSSGILVLPHTCYVGIVNFEPLFILADKPNISVINSISMYLGFAPYKEYWTGISISSSDMFNTNGFIISF